MRSSQRPMRCRTQDPVVEGSASVPCFAHRSESSALKPLLIIFFSFALSSNSASLASWVDPETATYRSYVFAIVSYQQNPCRLLSEVVILIGKQSPPVDNARLILPALRLRGAGQGDPFTLRGRDDNFPLHSTLGEDKLVQGPLVG